MNKQLAETVFYVTGKGELQSALESDIDQLVKEHPYFAPAQLLLVAKLKNENSYNLREQTQKASLFFNNSRWFQYQLSEIKLDDLSFNYQGIESTNEIVHKEEEEIKPIQQENIIENSSIATLVEEVKVEEKVIPENTYKVFESSSYNEIFIPNYSIPTVEHVREIFSGINRPEITVPTEKVVEENVVVIDEEKPVSIIEAVKHEVIEEVKTEDKIPDIEPIIIENTAKDNVKTQNFGLDLVKQNWEKPVADSAKSLLPFNAEPYYTIDYFASQGIKFDFTKEPHDKLTTKMLKFTDWLKKMKGIKPENMEFDEDDDLNKTIQNIAVNSNVTKEIVTETMADVFAKQGKTEKAIQLYIKLSFLIPHKSSYFATKIQELKGI